MKKIISIVVCFCSIMLSCCICFSSFAVSLNDGRNAMNAAMLDGECDGGLDYVYYAPNTQDGKKYPLMIWLHGAKSGEYKRAQLEWYEFSNWASDEYQARFNDAGGAFLLLPRSSINPTHNWYAADCISMKKTIDSFISRYRDVIDTTRIYISGYSTGGSMTWHMASAYPTFFAAAMPICSLYIPTANELGSLKNMSIWLFSCDQDPYITAATDSVKISYNYIKDITNRPLGVRLTTFTEAVWANGSKQYLDDGEHYIWGAVTNDMFMYSNEQYSYSTTKDATGSTITFTHPVGLIDWLSRQRTPEVVKKLSFFEKVAEFFMNIFRYIANLFS